jgi:hypothetical protein
MMNLVGVGETTHFVIRYDASIGTGAALRAQAVLATCERDLARASFYLPYAEGIGRDPYLEGHRIDVQVVDLIANRGGADNASTGGKVNPFYTIHIGAINGSGGPISDDFARFLFVAELAEVLMRAYGWNPGDSRGEALSRVMAEEAYPTQAYSEGGAPWVNAWMGTTPRDFRYIWENEFTDRNVFSYGIAILYINYLRSQLNYSLKDICGAGGTTLLDVFRHLNGTQHDDGIVGFRDLLEKHYPSGKPFTLLTNNPFPLYDLPDRRVGISVQQSIELAVGNQASDRVDAAVVGRWGMSPLLTAHLRPFYNCAVRGYLYTVDRSPRRLDCVASVRGFSMPRFSWRVNGKELVASEGSVAVAAKVSIDDPANPDTPNQATEQFSFSYKYQDEFSFAALNNRLVIRNNSHSGHYELLVEVSVQERDKGEGTTTANATVQVNAASVVYEQSYYDDRRRCSDAAKAAVEGHVKAVAKAVEIVRTLPDPVPQRAAHELLDALAGIRHALAGPDVSSEVALAAARVVAGELGVSADVVQRLLSTRSEADSAKGTT